MEDRFDTGIEDVWSALTDPGRLAHWMGEVAGDLRPGGEFHAHFFASGWEGTGRIESCEPPHRLLVLTTTPDEPDEHVIEATVTAYLAGRGRCDAAARWRELIPAYRDLDVDAT